MFKKCLFLLISIVLIYGTISSFEMLEAGSQYMGDTVGGLDAAGVFLFLEEDKPSDLDPELVPKPENSIFLFV